MWHQLWWGWGGREREEEERKRREERAENEGGVEMAKAGAREGGSSCLRYFQALLLHSITLPSQVARGHWEKGFMTSSRSKKLGSDQG